MTGPEVALRCSSNIDNFLLKNVHGFYAAADRSYRKSIPNHFRQRKVHTNDCYSCMMGRRLR
jgi:hypothetical protein